MACHLAHGPRGRCGRRADPCQPGHQAARQGQARRAVGRARTRESYHQSIRALLIAERAAILAGRDDEFVLVTLMYYTGLRWAEAAGLETRYARLRSIRVEWQLVELDPGGLVRWPPTQHSSPDIEAPGSLSALAAGHTPRTAPQPCACHYFTHAFPVQPGSAHPRRLCFRD